MNCTTLINEHYLILICYNYKHKLNYLTFGRIRHSKPLMLNNKLGLSLEYTLTKLFSHCMVVVERGSLFLISQNTARPL